MRIFLLSFLLISLASCHFLGIGEKVYGDGNIVKQERSTGNFSSVEVSGSITVRVRQATSSAVSIETDQNLQQYIEANVAGDKLVIHSRDGYNLDPSRDIIVYVSSPTFRDIDVSGACDIISEGLIRANEPMNVSVSGSGNIEMEVDLPSIKTEVSGSGGVHLKGRAANFESTVSGSGEIKCFDLMAETIKISISGGGDAEVNASKQLDVQVSGSGTVVYKGNPQVSKDISGSGSVEKAS